MILSLLLAATLAQNDARLLQAVSYVSSAEAQLAQSPGNEQVLRLLVNASRALDECRFIRLGVNPRNEADPDANARWEAMTEAERNAYGWFQCDRAIWGLSDAKAAAKRAGARDVRDRWIKPAMAELAALDRTVPVGSTPETVFGPHGHVGSYRALLHGLGYLRDHAESIMLEDYEHGFDTGWGQYGRIANSAHLAAAYWAGTKGQELGLVCRVLFGFKLLWTEIAEAFHQLFNYSKASDSWLNMDRAAGRALEMERCR